MCEFSLCKFAIRWTIDGCWSLISTIQTKKSINNEVSLKCPASGVIIYLKCLSNFAIAGDFLPEESMKLLWTDI